MDALTALHNRVSTGLLTDPAPNEQQRRNIFRAALRAADHGCLRPWRFLLIEGEARERLGEIFLRAAEGAGDGMDEAQRARTLAMPLRAPLIVVAVTRLQEHPKVPHLEQRMSTAAAVQAMLTAAYAEGVGAYWRTGALAYNPIVAKELGLAENERIDGFLYCGTPVKPPRPAPQLAVEEYFFNWDAS
ncbi:nitroreductase family protein [Microbulbifer thermotolerans]|uniref:Putative NAD(P)H nitroreductase n=1 Tax=Microbulbifer thermotolerans TaxID=252514 RepID=A0A143HM29_MICTH|nr:nitroreductase family protein [Microbulbifer thermotolerans]AMX02785.1 nitroreductase [Microbulbifer thermotolerans]MCX2779648.1 nitroreductase family protein [Microbulbifer thermotolerans]MCX2782614.1 nitroreductase family protein [Microbulbifer thermotolerans]MCX2794626.1 nitroreductase family protein [Microbulbifer thermotolerans]MCX2801454.1 nitroreductase family protein [Microbulbifer thermotolerans]